MLGGVAAPATGGRGQGGGRGGGKGWYGELNSLLSRSPPTGRLNIDQLLLLAAAAAAGLPLPEQLLLDWKVGLGPSWRRLIS